MNESFRLLTIALHCNENNDLPCNPKRARTCFACEARKYSRGWGHNLYNVEMLSYKFWSVWTEIKKSSVGTAGTLVASEKRLTVGLCFAVKITNRASEWEETYGQTLFCQKNYQSSLWVRRDLWSDFAFFLFVTKVTSWACKWEENYGRTKKVKKTTNRACEWGETYSRTCFIFFLLFRGPTLGFKKNFCFIHKVLIHCWNIASF